MTIEDNPKYFAHVCEVIKAVFMAEDKINSEHSLLAKVTNGKMTPDEYVEHIAAELISTTDKSEIAEQFKEE